MTLNEWEQSNIEVLTSREMGEWLRHRENRLLDKIKAETEEIEKNYGLDKATKYGNRNAKQRRLSYSTMIMYEVADIIDEIKEIIDKYKAESEDKE